MDADHSLSLRDDLLPDRIVLYLSTGLFGLTVVFATIQVVVRLTELQLGSIPLHWTEPLARFTLIIATYLGAAVATRNDEHIKMDYFPDRLGQRSPQAKRFLDILVSLIILGFVFVVLRGTLQNTISTWDDRFGAVQIVSSGMIYAGITFGFGLMFIYESSKLVQSVKMFIRTYKQEEP